MDKTKKDLILSIQIPKSIMDADSLEEELKLRKNLDVVVNKKIIDLVMKDTKE